MYGVTIVTGTLDARLMSEQHVRCPTKADLASVVARLAKRHPRVKTGLRTQVGFRVSEQLGAVLHYIDLGESY